MTEPLTLYLEAEQAVNNNATLTLFRQEKWAPIILATLMSVFDQGQREIEAGEFYGRVRRVFLAINEWTSDFPIDPHDGKALRDRCKMWVGQNWLSRAAPGDVEVYRLSPEAREAMRIAKELSNTRAAMSESQVRVILDRAQALALKATADPQARMTRLRDEIDRMTEDLETAMLELERLEAAGPVQTADDEVILNEFLSLRNEMERLPADLKQVEDEFVRMADEIMHDFLEDARPHGGIVGEYLRRVDNLNTADRYGRGYMQAKALLSSDTQRTALRRNLDTILAHPFADAMTGRERDDVRRVVRVIGESVSGVNDRRRELTARVSIHLRSHDAARERELAKALQAAQSAIRGWAGRHGHLARIVTPFGHAVLGTGEDGGVETLGEMSIIDATSIREQPAKRAVRTALVPLDESGGTSPVPWSAAAIRALGGPFYDELAAAIEDALVARATISGDAVFNALPDHLRRPVDLLGLLNLATDVGAVDSDGVTVTFESVRPDGSTQRFTAPAMSFFHHDDISDHDDH